MGVNSGGSRRLVQYAYFVDDKNPEYKAPWNHLKNIPRVCTPADTAIQTPNSDTPYSMIGMDLRAEPMVLTVSAIEKDRYFSIQRKSLEFFNIVNFVLRFCPTNPSDTELMARFATIGVGAGKTIDVAALSPDIKTARRAVTRLGHPRLRTPKEQTGSPSGPPVVLTVLD